LFAGSGGGASGDLNQSLQIAAAQRSARGFDAEWLPVVNNTI
jgi:hypothetical protein